MRKKSSRTTEPTDKLLPKLSLFFFDRPWLTGAIWLVLLVFGALSYTTFMKREGFPSINIPLVITSATYAKDAATVDAQLAKPVSDIALKQADVSSVLTSSQDNFANITVQYKESADPAKAKKDLEQAIKGSGSIPKDAELTFSAPYFGATGGSIEKIDATVSLYDKDQARSTAELTAIADRAVKQLNKDKGSQIKEYFVQKPFTTVADPASGVSTEVQRTFDRYAALEKGKPDFSNAVIIGVTGIENADVIELDAQIESSLTKLHEQDEFKDVDTAISASFAPSIEESITELQRVLLEGLIAVLIVGAIVIALRASIITVISMVSVLAIAIGVLFLTGYSLNVITLFALILGLSLIVDDTIIMVEAIDAARRKHTKARAVVAEASRKVSRAMVAATLTAAFSFVPLLFVTGILGSFIRAIPVTIISALLVSLFVALIFIPLFARFILLGKKQLGKEGHVVELAAGFEERLANFIGKPMLWSKGKRAKQFLVGSVAFVISAAFIVGAMMFFSKVTFNIFPASKDSNQLGVALTYPSGTSIAEAEEIADTVDSRVAKILGKNLVSGSYYGTATSQSATLNVSLLPYDEREVTAPQLVDKINQELQGSVAANVNAYQVDVGPPMSSFTVNINAENRAAAERAAKDIAAYLEDATLTRISGEKAQFEDVTVGNTDVYQRTEGEPILTVSAGFDGTDTSTLTTLAEDAVKKEFNASRLSTYGLPSDALSYDIGQESENQESFNSLALAFPLVLLATFVLLAIQFRSLLQPLLIFLAIPFSLFGVAFGLFITDNPISFFSLLGFFALIGLSIKNTILLTDFANQSRRAGMGPIDSAVAALAERFRPLIATSLTAIVSLIPLAITSPFWEGLAFTLIFGLASSTILVVLVFPYYYLAGEYFRMKTRRAFRRLRRRNR
ncbi:MAG TPA: efflux RND transporter permease subunit [Candidatus Saccharimonadales bacterium]